MFNHPDDVTSYSFGANNANALGSIVGFENNNNILTQCSVVMSNWWGWDPSRQTRGIATPGYTHPFSVELYEVDRSSNDALPGDHIITVTENKKVTGRRVPTEDDGSNLDGVGTAFLMTWNLPNVKVGNEVLFLISFDVPNGVDNQDALNSLNIVAALPNLPSDVTVGVNTDDANFLRFRGDDQFDIVRSEITSETMARFKGYENTTDATASATVQIDSVSISNGGSGYTATSVGQTVTLDGVSPMSSPQLEIASVGGGEITGLNIISTGEFEETPENPVGITGGDGTGATINISYKLKNITVDFAGSDYLTEPLITLNGDGTGAEATSTISNGEVSQIVINSEGTGYSAVPDVEIESSKEAVRIIQLHNVKTFSGLTIPYFTNGKDSPNDGEISAK